MAHSKKAQKTQKLLVGVDVGSTTTKIAAAEQISGELVYSDYRRHGAAQGGNRHPGASAGNWG